MAEVQSMSLSVRFRLSAMMFLQYMMLPVWFMPLAAYLDKLAVTGAYRAAIVSSMALGCLASPLIGMFADRHFASEKVLAVLNLLTAVLLVVSAQVASPPLAVFLLLLGAMLCYMPSWGLTSSIAMSHCPSAQFPQIRVFGSIGWVAAGLFSLVAMWLWAAKIDGTEITLYCGAGTALVSALFSLSLPHTPPPAKGKPAALLDVLGLRSLALMKDLSFAVFILIYLLVQIPFSIYFSYCSLFLKDQGFQFITVTMGWGQVAEMFFMLLIPLAIARVGVKWAMALGLVAMAVRYLAFLLGGMYDMPWLYFVAILVHGLIFGFYFVGGQIYVDRKAPKEMRAQAQAFVFLCYGLGSLVGNFANGELIDRNSRDTLAIAAPAAPADAAFPAELTALRGATATEVRLYDRVLSDTEVALLAADAGKDTDKAKLLQVEAKEKGETIELAKGLAYRGDLAGLAGKRVPPKMTFAAQFVLPGKEKSKEGKEQAMSGTLLSAGTGEQALQLALQDDVLLLKLGKERIVAQRVAVPFGKDKQDKDQPIHLAGSFDGQQLKLYTGGAAYRRYDWQPIWMAMTISSAALMLAFMLLFRDDTRSQTDEK